MKGFALDENGDVLIANNEIVMVNGTELLRQKIQLVLSTNKGEWSLNVEEGINFSNLLGKSVFDSGAAPTSETAVIDYSADELRATKSKVNALNERLARRLDGE